MNPVFASGKVSGQLRAAVIISLILVLPLVILEVWLGGGTVDTLPWMLFGALWLLPFVFVLIWPIAARGATSARAWVPLRLIGGAGLVLIAAVWLSLVADQMPCFLGFPNCD